MGKRPSRACLRNQRRDKHTSCYCLPNERIFCAMADVKVTCVCGAIYEVIKTVGPSRKRGLIMRLVRQRGASLASLALFIAMIALEDAPCLQRGHLHVAQRNTG